MIGRSVWTLRRWEHQGRVPPVRRHNGQRRYSDEDVVALRRLVERGVGDEGDEESAEAVRLEPVQPLVRSWAEMERGLMVASSTARDAHGQPVWSHAPDAVVPSPPDTVDLPGSCPTCHRPLIRHGIQDSYGRRWLVAMCDRHHEQGRTRW
jgi:hypothetical protein